MLPKGSNQESHNHLDVGHFVLGTTEELFLTDLGAGEYTKEYFDENTRYHYFPAAAISHSPADHQPAHPTPNSRGSNGATGR